MDTFKIENFKAENKDRVFPVYHHLSKLETKIIFDCLSDIFFSSGNRSPIKLVKIISQSVVYIEAFNASKAEFRLKAVLQHLNIEPDDDVYLNWYRFDDIDQIGTSGLDQYFHDIWYPSSDDIDIFDQHLSWIISIRHDGVLAYWNRHQV